MAKVALDFSGTADKLPAMTPVARTVVSGWWPTSRSRQPWLSLLKNIFGVGIGRQTIAAETYSWAGRYIGDV